MMSVDYIVHDTLTWCYASHLALNLKKTFFIMFYDPMWSFSIAAKHNYPDNLTNITGCPTPDNGITDDDSGILGYGYGM